MICGCIVTVKESEGGRREEGREGGGRKGGREEGGREGRGREEREEGGKREREGGREGGGRREGGEGWREGGDLLMCWKFSSEIVPILAYFEKISSTILCNCIFLINYFVL